MNLFYFFCAAYDSKYNGHTEDWHFGGIETDSLSSVARLTTVQLLKFGFFFSCIAFSTYKLQFSHLLQLFFIPQTLSQSLFTPSSTQLSLFPFWSSAPMPAIHLPFFPCAPPTLTNSAPAFPYHCKTGCCMLPLTVHLDMAQDFWVVSRQRENPLCISTVLLYEFVYIQIFLCTKYFI